MNERGKCPVCGDEAEWIECIICKGTGEYENHQCPQCFGDCGAWQCDACDAVAYQSMADDPTVDQAAWRDLAEEAKKRIIDAVEPVDCGHCAKCGGALVEMVCPVCEGKIGEDDSPTCWGCIGTGTQWLCPKCDGDEKNLG